MNGFIDTTTANQNCSDERACTWDLKVKKSWKAQLKHNAAQVFFFLNQFHDHLEDAPIGFNDAAGNFEFGGHAAGPTWCSPTHRTGPTPITGSPT